MTGSYATSPRPPTRSRAAAFEARPSATGSHGGSAASPAPGPGDATLPLAAGRASRAGAEACPCVATGMPCERPTQLARGSQPEPRAASPRAQLILSIGLTLAV